MVKSCLHAAATLLATQLSSCPWLCVFVCLHRAGDGLSRCGAGPAASWQALPPESCCCLVAKLIPAGVLQGDTNVLFLQVSLRLPGRILQQPCSGVHCPCTRLAHSCVTMQAWLAC